MTRVLLLGGNGDLEHRLGQMPSSLFVPVSARLVERSTFDINDLMVDGYLPDVVVLGPDIAREPALRIAQGIDLNRPGVNVVLVGKLNDAELLDAMRAGVRDVIPPDATREELMSMLVLSEGAGSRLAVPVSDLDGVADSKKGRIVVVVSPKGGVGKSTVTSNLSAGLAQAHPKQVVVVDLDLQFGDVATHLDLHPAHSLSDVFASAGGVDSMLLKTFLTVHSAGFYVLCAPTDPASADEIGPEQVKELLRQLVREFKFVVVDTGAGLDEPTLAALEEASDAVIVSSMDVSSVRNVRKEIEVLSQLGILPSRKHMVLNFADRKSGMSVRDVEAVLGIPVNIVVPRADDVVIATNRGIPVILQKKSGDVGKAVKALVKRVSVDDAPNKQKFLHKGVDVS